MSVDLDVAIVGGGPAGIATALFHAAAAPERAGRVVVLEKERYPREKICAGAIGARADRLLESIGVRVECPSVPVHGFSLVTGGGEIAERREEPIGRVVRRIEHDRAFAEAARARGVRIEEGARVEALSIERDFVRLETTRGEVRARVVVGADGVGSFVRRAIGLPRGHLRAQVVEVDTPEVSGDPPRDLLRFDIRDRALTGYAWDFPTLVGGEALMCRGLYALEPEAIGAAADGRPAIGALLEERLASAGALSGARKRKRFAERGLALHEPTARPRVLLVGEAAGIDPVLGEGIAQAIFYGAAAGRFLAERLGAGDVSLFGWPSAFARSSIGFDLGVRTRLVRVAYGAARPFAEKWLLRSPAFVQQGMRYFAGEHVSRAALARAAIDVARAAFA